MFMRLLAMSVKTLICHSREGGNPCRFCRPREGGDPVSLGESHCIPAFAVMTTWENYLLTSRRGINTSINDTITSASALNSCQRGRSSRNHILLNTPSTGIINVDNDVTLAEPWLINLFHAQ